MSTAACYTQFGVISPTLHISSMVAMLLLIYQYAKSMKSEQNQTLKNLGFALFSMQMIYCMASGSYNLILAFTSDCSMELGIEFLKKNYAVAITLFIGTTLWLAQYFVMILLLFYRLKVVFDGTTYELSQCITWAFYIMYVLLILLEVSSLLAIYLSVEDSLIGGILALFSGLCVISMIFFLTFLLVTKLIDVNKRCDGAQQKDQNKLLSTITKQSILTLISIVSLLASVIFSLSFTRGLYVSSIDANFVYNLCLLIDLWTNFICILLSYHSFNAYYIKMCGCCDIKCKQLCGKLAKQQRKNIESSSGYSVQSTSVSFE